MSEAFIAFTVLGGPLLLVAFWLWLRARHRRDLLQLADRAMEKGHALDPELVESLKTNARPDPERDMRRGIIYLSLALSVCVFALTVEEEVLLALASFPGFIGVAYLLFSRRRGSDAEPAPAEA
ncbi:MAG: DUF6249 domain-containing protein [Pseudomonadales bacterium]|nr:DUF6249 domain-containing protein [Pseudomonadales bacterium]